MNGEFDFLSTLAVVTRPGRPLPIFKLGLRKADPLRAHTTGSFAVHSRTNGREITPRGRKARALLAYLISDPGTKMGKDRLCALLWGDRGDIQARASLRQVVLELRRTLNDTSRPFFSDREHVWIAADSVVEAAVNDAEPKDAFEDLDNITPDFDEWLVGERCRRSRARISTLKAEAEELLAHGLAAESVGVIDKIQSLDPANEDALRLGMKAEFECGRSGQIAKRYETVAAVLKTDLGVEPSNKSRTLLDELLMPQITIDPAGGVRLCALYEAVERRFNIGCWECDLLSGQLWWSPGTFALYGVPISSAIRREDILNQYEPASRELLERVRDEAIRNGNGFSIEVEISTRTGVKKRLRINAAVESRDGTPLRIFGTKQLISEYKLVSVGRALRPDEVIAMPFAAAPLCDCDKAAVTLPT